MLIFIKIIRLFLYKHSKYLSLGQKNAFAYDAYYMYLLLVKLPRYTFKLWKQIKF